MKPKRSDRRGLSLGGLEPYIIITGIIIILLIILLLFLKKPGKQDIPPEQYETYIEVPEESPQKSPSETTVSPPAAPAAIPWKPEAEEVPELVFVIDDVGNSIEQLKPFLKLPFSITFAIMPDRRYTAECAAMIKAAGKEYILHQPMEAVGGADPGKSAIYTGMDAEEIRKILQHNFAQLPQALGLNNHMGSAATSDPEVMDAVMEYLHENDLFFLDSLTISNTMGKTAAESRRVPYLKRNSMFLDNENDQKAIIDAINEGRKVAEKSGHAVMIGHVMTGELADVLLQLYPGFIEDGFSLKEISELFIEMNNPGSKED